MIKLIYWLARLFGARLLTLAGVFVSSTSLPIHSYAMYALDDKDERNSIQDYVKSLVYADKPQTLDHLEEYIRHVIADIRPQMLEKVIENWTSRLDYIRVSRDSPMPEIIFKM
ncbi:hypothetical protein TNCV_3856371 [Trichonephila clavipes]|nr:hypothetical protein TNCV_3856371 [Trichonephila clavipes]